MTKRTLHTYIPTGAALSLLIALVCSCSTPKDISYFQDAKALNNMALQMEQQFRLRPEDKINIIINSSNPLLEQQFTLTASSKSNSILGADVTPVNVAGNTSGSAQLIAYTVDEQGTIDFPILGKLRVAGMTRHEVSAYIKDRLIARELVTDPIVTVEYVNLSVNVLGEVNTPGNIPITKDHFTLLDALAKAGDLTIDGNRRTVLVNRKNDGVNKVYQVDLTNMQQTLLSPAYYLEQNDLVYVQPNDKRKRESTVNGNTLHTPYLWMSLTSMLVSIAALLTR
ncbi:MAG: polysaccharide biosynthesis/export family protein [Prevotellaceae bacterium]|nr:polysaccharide biosynthesis/export family protein [Prevotellaceae bacterium]MDY3295867.1 polysaccharide biosynthesis/export family protein [Bacteroidaceae bacterium]